MAPRHGFEPRTFRLTAGRFYLLSYRGMDSEAGFEPARACASGFAIRRLRPLGYSERIGWRARTESNREPPDLESDALPIEPRTREIKMLERATRIERATSCLEDRSSTAELRTQCGGCGWIRTTVPIEGLVYSQVQSTALPHTRELAPPARLERAASGFVDRRSEILLS